MITLLLSLFIAGAAFIAVRALQLQLNSGMGERLRIQRESLQARLQRAGSGMQGRVGMLIAAAVLFSALALYAISDSAMLGLLGGIFGALLPWAYAQVLEKRQIAKFSGQLASVLDLLSGSLRSGQSLSQALQTVAMESPQPAGTHFAVVSQKLALGEAPELALDELASSLKGQACEEELRMLATSVSVTRSTGGNLAEILSQLGETVRERARMRAEIDSLTAQGKMSGWIVGSLPVFILIALNFLDSSLVAPIFHTTLGLGLLSIGVVLELLGAFLIKRIVSIDL